MYHDECDMIDNFNTMLQKADTDANGGKVTGRLKKENFLKVLRKAFFLLSSPFLSSNPNPNRNRNPHPHPKAFPLKTDVRFNRAKRALTKEDAASGKSVHYINLFREDTTPIAT